MERFCPVFIWRFLQAERDNKMGWDNLRLHNLPLLVEIVKKLLLPTQYSDLARVFLLFFSISFVKLKTLHLSLNIRKHL